MEKVLELTIAAVAATFRGIGRDRSSASANLIGQTINFFLWKPGDTSIALQRQLVGFIPKL